MNDDSQQLSAEVAELAKELRRENDSHYSAYSDPVEAVAKYAESLAADFRELIEIIKTILTDPLMRKALNAKTRHLLHAALHLVHATERAKSHEDYVVRTRVPGASSFPPPAFDAQCRHFIELFRKDLEEFKSLES